MAKQQKINEWYLAGAQRLLEIDETDEGQLYCDVPSESNPMALKDGKWYRVDVDQSLLAPQASSCQCKGFEVHRECKHCTVVNLMFQRIYKSNVLKAQIKQETSPVVASTSYTMPDALLSKLASLSEEESTASEESKVVDEEAMKHDASEALEEVYAELRELSGKTMFVPQEDSTGIEMLRKRQEPVLNNAPQSDVAPSWLKVLPSWQQKQQEAMAS